jgi:Trypsin-like peptidase domain
VSPAIQIDHLSLCTVPIFPFCYQHALAQATAFWYRRGDDPYLVTNWHVLSGRNPITGQPRHAQGAVPNTLQTHLQAPDLGFVTPRRIIDLYHTNKTATWWQHPLGQDIDLAVLPIEFVLAEDRYKIYAVNDLESDPLLFDVGVDAFIIGYPLDVVHHGYLLPIWKRGSIATTPSLPFAGSPAFLVDSLTREGMSGSPVVVRTVGTALMENGAMESSPSIYSRFVGVYSGRYGADDQLGPQLGRVWHTRLIDEIIDHQRTGTYELR